MPTPSKTPKKENTVMDVSRPGKTAPTASAKPIIVGHGPMVQDPMVTAETKPVAESPEAPKAQPVVATPSAAKKIISPITQQKSEATAEPEAVTPDEETQVASSETPDPASASLDDTAVVDAIVDQVGDKKHDVPTEEDRKQQEKIERLIAEKKYFVPLGKLHQGSSKAITVIVLLLVFALLGSAAAIDAELVDTGVALPFDVL